MQNQQITQGKTAEIPFVLLDSVKKTGKDVAVETIKLTVSKAGGPLVAVANPAISGRGMGLYYWGVAPTDTDTLGDLVYFADSPGCDTWRDMVSIVEPEQAPHEYLVTQIPQAGG